MNNLQCDKATSISYCVAKNASSEWLVLYKGEGNQCLACSVDNVGMAELIHDVVTLQTNSQHQALYHTYSKLDIIAMLSIEQIFEQRQPSDFESHPSLSPKCHETVNNAGLLKN